jgi:excisionase family DNA binding protein
METHQLPPELERIAQKAEAGAAELARGLVTFVYQQVSDLVEEARSSTPPSVQNQPKASASHKPPQGQFLSVEEAAELLRLKPSTIYAWVSKNEIPYSKVGSRVLFEREALVEFVKTRESRKKKPREKDSQTPIRMVK